MAMQLDPMIPPPDSHQYGLATVLHRLRRNMERDRLVQQITGQLRASFQVDRVLLYYFYTQWEGQVTFESLSHDRFSILGSTGPDQCFNDEYAALYLDGRVRAITNINTADIEPCHRNFLSDLQVQANLVVPILSDGLWGLLVAHHCQSPRYWVEHEIERMKAGALILASSNSIISIPGAASTSTPKDL